MLYEGTLTPRESGGEGMPYVRSVKRVRGFRESGRELDLTSVVEVPFDWEDTARETKD